MRISGLNFNSPVYFASKSKEVKEADYIKRKAKLACPLMSDTYVKDFYGVYSNVKGKNYFRANGIQTDLCYEIHENRDEIDDEVYEEDCETLTKALNIWIRELKKTRIGDCYENALSGFAALLANGYYNSSLVTLLYGVEIVDKKSGEVLFERERDLDHCFVITDMKKGLNPDNEKKFVVDPWLSFADSKEGAKGKFKALYGEDYLKDIKKKTLKFYKDYGPDINKDDIEVRGKFIFEPCDSPVPEDGIKKSGRLLRKEFPELVIKSSERKKN